MRSPFLALLLAGTVLSACSHATLIPDRSPRIQMAIVNGQPAFAKDGVVQPAGFLGLPPEEVVAGNPAAMARLHSGRMKSGLGFGVLMAAGALVVGAVTDEAMSPADTSGRRVAALAFGAALLDLGAIYLLVKGQNDAFDALGLYNDGVSAKVVDAAPPEAKPEVPQGPAGAARAP